MTTPQNAAAEDTPLQAITGFHLVTQDLPRLVGFYHDVLGFALNGPAQRIDDAETALLAILGRGLRQALTIGRQRIVIEQFEAEGRPYPVHSDAASFWFQHLALVVVDIAEAYSRLRDAVPISLSGPQQLPAASGGVKAFKFRDPDGHPLELLEFQANGMPNA